MELLSRFPTCSLYLIHVVDALVTKNFNMSGQTTMNITTLSGPREYLTIVGVVNPNLKKIEL
jgi:hypothetical protein